MVYCTSCRTTVEIGSDKWPLPEKPKMQPVEITPLDKGFFISEDNAENLANNITNIKAYIEKLETLIKKMGEHYK